MVEVEDGKDSKGLLRRRIAQALTSGHLNITGMNLKQIPTEVTNMYESSENSTANWSEMVDLIKFSAANNELNELGDDTFPNYSPEDMMNDDEKTNQFGGLEHIDLHGNQLSRIPIGFCRLERLQVLNLSNNKLANESLKVIGQVKNLRELVLGDNLISKMDFGNYEFEDLQILDLRNNDIREVHQESISTFKSLKVLNLANNNFVGTFPWHSMEKLPLIDLNISNNHLLGTLFDVKVTLPHLHKLDASHNALKEIGEGSLPNLRSLAVNNNHLTKLPDLDRSEFLHTLLASENELEELPVGFSKLTALKVADFAHNNIRMIDPDIALMDELSSLTLVGNPLREKKFLTMSTTEIKLGLEKKLETEHDQHHDEGILQVINETAEARYRPINGVLDLSAQSLTTINLGDIDLDNSNGVIHTLKLSNNELTAVPCELLAHPALKYSLQSLDLSHNPLLHPTQYLTSELFLPSLKSLYIVSTGLTSLDALTTYMKAPALAELNISCHRLAGRVPWVQAWFPNCTTLLATDNWFTSIDPEGVRGLEVLDIRNNEIESLPAKIGLCGNFVGSAKEAGKLRVLEVSGNRFRVPRLAVLEKGTEAILKDLRRMIPENEVPEEWKEMV